MIIRAFVPLLHLLLHVNTLFLQQFSLGEGPVHWLYGGLCCWGLLTLSTSLLRVVKAEHMVLSHDNAVT